MRCPSKGLNVILSDKVVQYKFMILVLAVSAGQEQGVVGDSDGGPGPGPQETGRPGDINYSGSRSPRLTSTFTLSSHHREMSSGLPDPGKSSERKSQTCPSLTESQARHYWRQDFLARMRT